MGASHQTQTLPMLFTPYQLPLFNFRGQVGLRGYFDTGSGTTTHQTQYQTQATSFTPHQPPQFNFGTAIQVPPNTLRVQVIPNSYQHNLNSSVNGVVQSPLTFTASNIQTVPIQTLPAPPTQAFGPLATIQVPPAPPKSPIEPGVINIPQHPSSSSADTKGNEGDPGCSKQKHVLSQHALRDNVIRVVGKENHVPPPASKGATPRGKKWVASGDAVKGQGVTKYVLHDHFLGFSS